VLHQLKEAAGREMWWTNLFKKKEVTKSPLESLVRELTVGWERGTERKKR